jgi:DNA gyrase subunit A
MSVIRAEQVAAEEAAEEAVGSVEESEVKEQYVFTITDGGFAKRTRINDYRSQGRGGLGIKAMSLANEDRGVLVGAFIVEEGDEVLSITQAGQVVRSPINDNFRPTGRSTMGVKFVTPKGDDAVAVVARSMEAKVVDEVEGEEGDETEDGNGVPDQTGPEAEPEFSSDQEPGVTIDETVPDEAASDPGESEG